MINTLFFVGGENQPSSEGAAQTGKLEFCCNKI